ncbi:MAG: hypothetical protein ISS47_06625 [Candidatus Omnitrophica bacterium]|nr:hypothetical protein [Candidatus Omnitrophota bacterium]
MPRDGKHLKKYQWKKGESGNPSGTPKGVRKLREIALEAFFKAFEATGGEEGLIRWVKQNSSHRAKFYSWLVPLFPKEAKFEHTGDGVGNLYAIIQSIQKTLPVSKDEILGEKPRLNNTPLEK